jgi:2-polyprenyl-6-methoxyphenol hydroxylase-like FAD-dependent oxidoreductase
MTDTDVLIVGAGPTGLMLANQLARRGVRAVIIDRHSGPAQQTRALGVQARTLEVYQKLGIDRRAIELGKIGNGANIWADGRKMARVPLGDAGRSVTPYPYILVLGQDDNERLMGERLHDFGLSVQWNTELVGLAQDASAATATLRMTDGSARAMTATWISGCDGAHSAVRELSAITFPGAPYEHVFFVADTEVTGTMVPDEVNVYLWRSGFHLFFPMRGQDHWRIVGIVPAALRDRPDLEFDDVLASLRTEAGDALSFRGCSWFSTYRIHHRAASRFRDRRCFLLGDAAHIHSPMGAQGMNTGLQDAYNLAWKLALVIAGRADAALLDSYEQERIPVARQLLETTDRAFRLVVSDSPWAGVLRTQVLARAAALAMSQPRIQAFAFRTVSQIGIEYRASALSHTQDAVDASAPRAGDRFPWLHLALQSSGPGEDLFQTLDDLHFHLFVFGQAPMEDAAAALGDAVQVHAVPATPGNDKALAQAHIGVPSYYLVRPDGYIGLCGTRIDATAIAAYIGTRLRMRSLAAA